MITQPHNITGCMGGTAVFTCVMRLNNVRINTDNIAWWRRRIDQNSETQPIKENNKFNITNNINEKILTSVLVITGLRSGLEGPYWLGMANSTRWSDVAFLSILLNGMYVIM